MPRESPGWVRMHPPDPVSAPWLTPRIERCRAIAELAGFAPAGPDPGAAGDLEVVFVGGVEGDPVVREGLSLATWSDSQGILRVAIHRPELAEEALVAALSAAGRDPRGSGRFAAVAPVEADLRERAGVDATIRPSLPGEWWVTGAGVEPPGPAFDSELRPPEVALGRALAGAGLTVATAESCTGGGILERLTAIPGSSAYVERGWVTYTNQAKEQILGVPGGILDKHGAVSEPVARAMVQGALERSPADLALAVTGVAGPSGGSPTKPVGLVWIAAGRRGGGTLRSRRMELPGERGEVRWRSVNAAIGLALEVVPGGLAG